MVWGADRIVALRGGRGSGDGKPGPSRKRPSKTTAQSVGSREKRNFRKEQKLAQRKLSNLAGSVAEVRRGLYLIQCGIFVPFIFGNSSSLGGSMSRSKSQRMITWPDGLLG